MRSKACTGWIQPGDRYVRHVASPRYEFGSGRFWVLDECGPCTVDRRRGGQVTA